MTVNELMKKTDSDFAAWMTSVPHNELDHMAYAFTNFSFQTTPTLDEYMLYAKRTGILKATLSAPPEVETIREDTVPCSCGHHVSKSLVMSASFGTSCPECYDRMSE